MNMDEQYLQWQSCDRAGRYWDSPRSADTAGKNWWLAMSQWSAQLHEVLHFDLTQPGWRKPKQGCWTCRFRQPVTQTYSKWWHKHKTSQNESESPPTAFLPCNSKKPWSGRWLHRPSARIWDISISKHQLQLKQNTNNGRGTSRSRRTADVTRIHEYKIIHTTIIWRRLRNIRGMEIQLYGLHSPRRSPTTVTTDKIRNSDTTRHEWTTYGWSSNNTGRNKVDQLSNRAAVHDQHHQRTSGKSRQAGINTNGLETWRQDVSRFSIRVSQNSSSHI